MKQRAEKKIYMEKLGKRAVSAKETVAFLNVIQRQEGLILAADALMAQQAYIIEENQKDIMLARKNKMTEPLIDRLLLNENRIRKMAELMIRAYKEEKEVEDLVVRKGWGCESCI